MTTRKFIIKGVLPLILFGIITWLGQYIFMVDGSIDWFRFMLVYGVPVGIIITIYGYYYSNKVGFVRNDGRACVGSAHWSCLWILYCSWNCGTGNLLCDCIPFKCFDREEEEKIIE